MGTRSVPHGFSPRFSLSGIRSAYPRSVSRHPAARLACAAGAMLLMGLASCTLLLFWVQTPPSSALAASGCPISGLPPTPTSAPSANPPNSIQFSEILTSPKKDWDCDGDTGAHNQWIELKNSGSSNASLAGLQLLSTGSPYNLNFSDRIAGGGYLVIFSDQIPSIPLYPGGGTLQLLDSSGNAIDTVNYPALGTDQSYARNSSGQWYTSSTPTPGKANTNGPAPTATRRSGGSGGPPAATSTPISTVVIPTDTPDAVFQNPGTDPSTGGGGTNNTAVPSWLKITLLAGMGLALVGVLIWYFHSWSQEPEERA